MPSDRRRRRGPGLTDTTIERVRHKAKKTGRPARKILQDSMTTGKRRRGRPRPSPSNPPSPGPRRRGPAPRGKAKQPVRVGRTGTRRRTSPATKTTNRRKKPVVV